MSENQENPIHAGPDGWTDWQTPTMQSYRMQCCDCGLTHEAEFRVYRVDDRPAPDETYGPEMPAAEYRVQFRMKRKDDHLRRRDCLPVDTAVQSRALRNLMQEAAAILAMCEPQMREAAGNTNVACLQNRINEAAEALAGAHSWSEKHQADPKNTDSDLMAVIDTFGIRYSVDPLVGNPAQPYYILVQASGRGMTCCYGKTAREAAEGALEWLNRSAVTYPEKS
jgi:hypothetical protein